MTEMSVSHIGLCVTDLDTSLRFYTEGLGFEVAETYTAGGEVAAAAEIDTAGQMTSQMLLKDNFRLELLWWADEPGCVGAPSTTRNQLGLTHLSFAVDDIPSAEARLVALGAKVIEPTRTSINNENVAADLVFLTDPDGTRIELVNWGNAASKPASLA